MSDILRPDSPELRAAFYRLYREFFAHAERKRRWSLEDDIPWDQVNRNLDPAIGDVVESFCAVELYLPDYIAKAMPMTRGNKGWAWFHANWGYEESKHSLALGDWLLKSGARSDEQMADVEGQVSAREYEPPEGSGVGMIIYAMVQELATFVHYRNLRRKVDEEGDPALSRLLTLVAVDERAHHAFYRNVVQLFLELDRKETLEQVARIMLNFSMPAVYLLADSRKRMNEVRELGIFSEELYFTEVYQPILASLGLSHRDIRGPRGSRKSTPSSA
jgi:acyl-[acyl-carrier-protein] desaturase